MCIPHLAHDWLIPWVFLLSLSLHLPPALPDIVRVPLRILYASTTGTGKLLSGVLQREAFAMNVSGFHFDVSVSDIASYDYVGGLEVGTEKVMIMDGCWTRQHSCPVRCKPI